MTATLPLPNLITMAIASLAAAKSAAELDVQVFYLATAREAVDTLEDQVKRLRMTLVAMEAELARKGRSPQTKRMSEGGRG